MFLLLCSHLRYNVVGAFLHVEVKHPCIGNVRIVNLQNIFGIVKLAVRIVKLLYRIQIQAC
jgi:hypothetical protein